MLRLRARIPPLGPPGRRKRERRRDARPPVRVLEGESGGEGDRTGPPPILPGGASPGLAGGVWRPGEGVSPLPGGGLPLWVSPPPLFAGGARRTGLGGFLEGGGGTELHPARLLPPTCSREGGVGRRWAGLPWLCAREPAFGGREPARLLRGKEGNGGGGGIPPGPSRLGPRPSAAPTPGRISLQPDL